LAEVDDTCIGLADQLAVIYSRNPSFMRRFYERYEVPHTPEYDADRAAFANRAVMELTARFFQLIIVLRECLFDNVPRNHPSLVGAIKILRDSAGDPNIDETSALSVAASIIFVLLHVEDDMAALALLSANLNKGDDFLKKFFPQTAPVQRGNAGRQQTNVLNRGHVRARRNLYNPQDPGANGPPGRYPPGQPPVAQWPMQQAVRPGQQPGYAYYVNQDQQPLLHYQQQQQGSCCVLI